ncbi:hypothetical protein U0070_020864, partial [Myodes glareolus]
KVVSLSMCFQKSWRFRFFRLPHQWKVTWLIKPRSRPDAEDEPQLRGDRRSTGKFLARDVLGGKKNESKLAIFAETPHSGVKCNIAQDASLGQISEAGFGQDISP